MKAVSGLALFGALALTAVPAQAQEEGSPHAFSGNVALTSDYVYRGISQSNGGIALQGGFDYTHESGFYAGTWASSVDFNPNTNLEVDIYGGLRTAVGGIDLDVGVVAYIYPDNESNFDYVEGYVEASHTYDSGLRLGVATFVSPEFFGETGFAWYVEGNAALPVNDVLSVSGAVGFQDVEGGVTVNDDSYTTWNLGGTLALAGFALDLRYHDSTIDENDLQGVGSRGVATLSRAF